MKLFKKTEKLSMGDQLIIDMLEPQVQKIKQKWIDHLSENGENTENKRKDFKHNDVSKVLLLSMINHIHHLEEDMLSKRGFLVLGTMLIVISKLLEFILP